MSWTNTTYLSCYVSTFLIDLKTSTDLFARTYHLTGERSLVRQFLPPSAFNICKILYPTKSNNKLKQIHAFINVILLVQLSFLIIFDRIVKLIISQVLNLTLLLPTCAASMKPWSLCVAR